METEATLKVQKYFEILKKTKEIKNIREKARYSLTKLYQSNEGYEAYQKGFEELQLEAQLEEKMII